MQINFTNNIYNFVSVFLKIIISYFIKISSDLDAENLYSPNFLAIVGKRFISVWGRNKEATYSSIKDGSTESSK